MATNQDPQGSSHSKQRLSQTPFSGAEAVRKIMENFAGIQSAMTRFGETLYSISASANKVDFEFGNLARMIKMGRSSYSGGSTGNSGGQYSSWNPNGGKDSSAFKPESMDVYEARLIEKKKIYDKVNLRKKEINEDPGGLQKYKANLMAKEEMYKVFLRRTNIFYQAAMEMRELGRKEIFEFYNEQGSKNTNKKSNNIEKNLRSAKSYYEENSDGAISGANEIRSPRKTSTIKNVSDPLVSGDVTKAAKIAHSVVLDLETSAPEGIDPSHPDYNKLASVIQAAVLFLDEKGNTIDSVNHYYPLPEGHQYPAKFKDTDKDGHSTFNLLEQNHRVAIKSTPEQTAEALEKALKNTSSGSIFAGHNHGAEGFDLSMLEGGLKGSIANAIFEALNPFMQSHKSHDTMQMPLALFARQAEIENKPADQTDLFKAFAKAAQEQDPTLEKSPSSEFTLEAIVKALSSEVEEFSSNIDIAGANLTGFHDAFSDATLTGIVHNVLLKKLNQQTLKKLNLLNIPEQKKPTANEDLNKPKSDAPSANASVTSKNILNVGEILQVEIVKAIPLLVTIKGTSPNRGVEDNLAVRTLASAETDYNAVMPANTSPLTPPIPVAIKKVPPAQSNGTTASQLGSVNMDADIGLPETFFSKGMSAVKRKEGPKENNILDADMKDLFKSFSVLAHPILSKSKVFNGTLPPEKNVAIGAETHAAFDSLPENAQNLIQGFQRAFNIDISELIDFSSFKVFEDKKNNLGVAGRHSINGEDGNGLNSISLTQKPSDTGDSEASAFNTFLHESIHAMFSRLRGSLGLEGLGKVESIDTSVLEGLPKSVAEQYNKFAQQTKKAFIKTLAIQDYGNDNPDSIAKATEDLKSMPYFAKPEEQYATLTGLSQANVLTQTGNLSSRQKLINANPAFKNKNNPSTDLSAEEVRGPESVVQSRRGFIGSVLSGVLAASLSGAPSAQASEKKSLDVKKQEYESDKAKGFDSAIPYWGKLIEVLDGDTIKALVNGVQVSIRTEYNDAPEKDQPFGKESKEYLEKLLGPPGSEFYATPKPGKDKGREPAYNRPLARINNTKGQDVATEMVRAGMSMPAFDDSSPMSDNIRKLGAQAGESEIGVHQFTHRGSPNILASKWRGFSPDQKAWHWKQRKIAETKTDPRDVSPQEPPPQSTTLTPMAIGLGLAGVAGAGFALDRANNNRLARERKRKRHEEEDASPSEIPGSESRTSATPEVPNLGLDRGLAMMKKYAKGKLVSPLKDRGPSLLGNFIRAIVKKAKLPLILGTVALLAGSMITQASHAAEVEPPSNKAATSLVSELGDKLTPEPSPELDNPEPPSPAPTPTPEEDVKPAIVTHENKWKNVTQMPLNPKKDYEGRTEPHTIQDQWKHLKSFGIEPQVKGEENKASLDLQAMLIRLANDKSKNSLTNADYKDLETKYYEFGEIGRKADPKNKNNNPSDYLPEKDNSADGYGKRNFNEKGERSGIAGKLMNAYMDLKYPNISDGDVKGGQYPTIDSGREFPIFHEKIGGVAKEGNSGFDIKGNLIESKEDVAKNPGMWKEREERRQQTRDNSSKVLKAHGLSVPDSVKTTPTPEETPKPFKVTRTFEERQKSHKANINKAFANYSEKGGGEDTLEFQEYKKLEKAILPGDGRSGYPSERTDSELSDSGNDTPEQKAIKKANKLNEQEDYEKRLAEHDEKVKEAYEKSNLEGRRDKAYKSELKLKQHPLLKSARDNFADTKKSYNISHPEVATSLAAFRNLPDDSSQEVKDKAFKTYDDANKKAKSTPEGIKFDKDEYNLFELENFSGISKTEHPELLKTPEGIEHNKLVEELNNPSDPNGKVYERLLKEHVPLTIAKPVVKPATLPTSVPEVKPPTPKEDSKETIKEKTAKAYKEWRNVQKEVDNEENVIKKRAEYQKINDEIDQDKDVKIARNEWSVLHREPNKTPDHIIKEDEAYKKFGEKENKLKTPEWKAKSEKAYEEYTDAEEKLKTPEWIHRERTASIKFSDLQEELETGVKPVREILQAPMADTSFGGFSGPLEKDVPAPEVKAPEVELPASKAPEVKAPEVEAPAPKDSASIPTLEDDSKKPIKERVAKAKKEWEKIRDTGSWPFYKKYKAIQDEPKDSIDKNIRMGNAYNEYAKAQERLETPEWKEKEEPAYNKFKALQEEEAKTTSPTPKESSNWILGLLASGGALAAGGIFGAKKLLGGKKKEPKAPKVKDKYDEWGESPLSRGNFLPLLKDLEEEFKGDDRYKLNIAPHDPTIAPETAIHNFIKDNEDLLGHVFSTYKRGALGKSNLMGPNAEAGLSFGTTKSFGDIFDLDNNKTDSKALKAIAVEWDKTRQDLSINEIDRTLGLSSQRRRDIEASKGPGNQKDKDGQILRSQPTVHIMKEIQEGVRNPELESPYARRDAVASTNIAIVQTAGFRNEEVMAIPADVVEAVTGLQPPAIPEKPPAPIAEVEAPKPAPKKQAGFLEKVLSLFSSRASVVKQPRPKPKTKEEFRERYLEAYAAYQAESIYSSSPDLLNAYLEAKADNEAYLKKEEDRKNAENEASKLNVEDDTLFPEDNEAEKNPSIEAEPIVAPEAAQEVTPEPITAAPVTELPTYAEVIKSYGFQTIKDHLNGIKPEDGEYTSEQEEQRTALNTEINRRNNFKPGIPGTISKDVNNEQVYTAEDGANYPYSETEGIDTRFSRSGNVDPDISNIPKTPPVDRNPYKDKPAPVAQPTVDPIAVAKDNLATAQKQYDIQLAKDNAAQAALPDDQLHLDNGELHAAKTVLKTAQKDYDALVPPPKPQPTATPTPTPVGGTPLVVTPVVSTAGTTTKEQEAAAKKVEDQNKLDKANEEKTAKDAKVKNVPLGKKTSAYVKKLEAENVKHNADLQTAQQKTADINALDTSSVPEQAEAYKNSKENEASLQGKIEKNTDTIDLIKKISIANIELKKISIQEPDKLRTRRLERASYINQLAKLGSIDLATKEKLLDSHKEEYDAVEEKFSKTAVVDTKPKSEQKDIEKTAKENKEGTKFQEADNSITLLEALGETVNRLTGTAYGDVQKGLDGKDKKPIDFTKSFKNMSSLFYGSQEKDIEGNEVKSFDYKGTTVDSKGNKTEQEGTVKAGSAEEALAMLNDECGMFVNSLVTAETGLFGWIARFRGLEGSGNEMDTDEKNNEGTLTNNATAHALDFNQQQFEDSDKSDHSAPYLAKIIEILQAIMAKNAIVETPPVSTFTDTNPQPEVEPTTANPKKKKKKKKNSSNPTMMGANEGPQLPEEPQLPIQMGANAGPQQVQMGANDGPKTPILMGPNAGPQDSTSPPATPSSNPTAGMDTGSVSKDDTSKNKHESLVKEYEKADLELRKFIDANKDKPGFNDTDSDLDREKKRLKANVEAASEKFNAPTQPKRYAKGKSPVQRQGTDNVEGRFKSRSGKIGTEPIIVGQDESIITASATAANPALIAEMNRTGKPVKSFKKGYTPAKAESGFLTGMSNFFSKRKSEATEGKKPTTFGGKFSSGDILAPLKVFGEQLQNTRIGFFAKSLMGLGGAATHAMNSLASFTKSAGGDTFNTLTGSIDLLIGAIGIQLTPLILRISQYIQSMATEIQDGTGFFGGMVKSITDFINSISNADLKFLISLGAIAAGVSALLPLFGILTGALGILATGVSMVFGMFASPVLLVVGAIAGLIVAVGGFQGIINTVCMVLNNYKSILGLVAIAFGTLAAVWVVANAPLIALALAVGLCVSAVMKAASWFSNMRKTPEQKKEEAEEAKKNPGIAEKLKDFKMPDMSALTSMFEKLPGGKDMMASMGIKPDANLPSKKYKDMTDKEKAAQDKIDEKIPVTKKRDLTLEEHRSNDSVEAQKQELKEKKASVRAKSSLTRTGVANETEEKLINSYDTQIAKLDTQIIQPPKTEISNVKAERDAYKKTPEGKKEAAKDDLDKKKASLDALGGQLAMSMKANRAQPAFSSVEEASKKIQISALGVDPLEAKKEQQAQLNLQQQLKAYSELNASVLAVDRSIQAQQNK